MLNAQRPTRLASLALASALLAGCGGGGGGSGGLVSTPTPPPAPTPTPTPSPTPTPEPTPPPAGSTVAIFEAPATQEFTVLAPPFDVEPVRLRYDAERDVYEIAIYAGFEPLRTSDIGEANPHADFYQFGPDEPLSYLSVSVLPGYRYARLGWVASDQPNWGIAFGIATPEGAVPVTGSATYAGTIQGATDAVLYDGASRAGFRGTIDFAFDFAAGTMSGAMTPEVSWSGAWDGGVQQFDPVALVDTQFATGATGFSGRFDSALSGWNQFSGQFAGPNAEEVFGSFVFPFVWSSDPAAGGDGNEHLAWGVFIAKR